MNKRKFKHYAFEIFLSALGLGTFTYIIVALFIAFTHHAN